MERAAALGRKHLIEDQEQRLRRETLRLRKENKQLKLETELAVTNAKLHVLEMNSSKRGSKRSDGMNSYFKRNSSKKAIQLSPRANTFVPVNMDEQRHVFPVFDPITQPQVVRPATQTVYENLVDVPLSKTLNPELLPLAVSTVYERNMIVSRFG